MSFVNTMEALLINRSNWRRAGDNVTIQSQGWSCGGFGERSAWRSGLWENSNGIVESSWWAMRSGSINEC